MRADRVELSWDAVKPNWLLRIEVGEEVIRRHCVAPKKPTNRVYVWLLGKLSKMKATSPTSHR
jgi:hypothetical protein